MDKLLTVGWCVTGLFAAVQFLMLTYLCPLEAIGVTALFGGALWFFKWDNE